MADFHKRKIVMYNGGPSYTIFDPQKNRVFRRFLKRLKLSPRAMWWERTGFELFLRG